MGLLKVFTPIFSGNEKKYLSQSIDEGEVSNGGRFVREFEEAFAAWSGNDYAVAVSSGTAALEVAIWAMSLDEISIPTGTIISCYIAAKRAGAKINLHDNIEVLEPNLMRCHLFGKFDTSTGLAVVDDLSQFWEPYRVKDVGCYSLYANKLITSGEGGVVVTNSKEIYDRAKNYINLCHSEERFVHYHLGHSFRMSNLQAAVALAQLEQIDQFVEIKKRNGNLYMKYLPYDVECLFKVSVPWMYLIKTKNYAGEMVEKLAKEGIECRRFFYPIHRQPCVENRDFTRNFPVADDLWASAFYLPSGLTLTEEEIIRVCGALRDALND